MTHVWMFIINSTFKLPFVGLKRTATLMRQGGCLGFIGGALGIIPYAAGFFWILYGFATFISQGEIPPVDEAGLSRAGAVNACGMWVIVALIGVVAEYVGYGIQSLFRGVVAEMPEMEWG
jgi:hypothetical protein